MPDSEVLERFERFIAEQVTSGPVPEADLRALELRLGFNLPADYRAFLARFGSGLYFGAHEILGASTVFVHDIELVADVATVRDRMLAEGRIAPRHLPFHSTGGSYHVIDVQTGEVRGLGSNERHPDFTTFLARVVLPA